MNATSGDVASDLIATAEHDILSLWSRGAIAGSFWAGHDIGSVMGYESITSALIHAVNRIESIDCWRNVTGSIGADTIGRIVAGGSTSAQISGTVSYQAEQDHWVYGPYPADPNVNLAAMQASLAGGRRGIEQYLDELELDKSAQAMALAAGEATLAENQFLAGDEFAAAVTQATAGIARGIAAVGEAFAWSGSGVSWGLWLTKESAKDVSSTLGELRASAQADASVQLLRASGQMLAETNRAAALGAEEASALRLTLSQKQREKSAAAVRMRFEPQQAHHGLR